MIDSQEKYDRGKALLPSVTDPAKAEKLRQQLSAYESSQASGIGKVKLLPMERDIEGEQQEKQAAVAAMQGPSGEPAKQKAPKPSMSSFEPRPGPVSSEQAPMIGADVAALDAKSKSLREKADTMAMGSASGNARLFRPPELVLPGPMPGDNPGLAGFAGDVAGMIAAGVKHIPTLGADVWVEASPEQFRSDPEMQKAWGPRLQTFRTEPTKTTDTKGPSWENASGNNADLEEAFLEYRDAMYAQEFDKRMAQLKAGQDVSPLYRKDQLKDTGAAGTAMDAFEHMTAGALGADEMTTFGVLGNLGPKETVAFNRRLEEAHPFDTFAGGVASFANPYSAANSVMGGARAIVPAGKTLGRRLASGAAVGGLTNIGIGAGGDIVDDARDLFDANTSGPSLAGLPQELVGLEDSRVSHLGENSFERGLLGMLFGAGGEALGAASGAKVKEARVGDRATKLVNPSEDAGLRVSPTGVEIPLDIKNVRETAAAKRIAPVEEAANRVKGPLLERAGNRSQQVKQLGDKTSEYYATEEGATPHPVNQLWDALFRVVRRGQDSAGRALPEVDTGRFKQTLADTSEARAVPAGQAATDLALQNHGVQMPLDEAQALGFKVKAAPVSEAPAGPPPGAPEGFETNAHAQAAPAASTGKTVAVVWPRKLSARELDTVTAWIDQKAGMGQAAKETEAAGIYKELGQALRQVRDQFRPNQVTQGAKGVILDDGTKLPAGSYSAMKAEIAEGKRAWESQAQRLGVPPEIDFLPTKEAQMTKVAGPRAQAPRPGRATPQQQMLTQKLRAQFEKDWPKLQEATRSPYTGSPFRETGLEPKQMAGFEGNLRNFKSGAPGQGEFDKAIIDLTEGSPQLLADLNRIAGTRLADELQADVALLKASGHAGMGGGGSVTIPDIIGRIGRRLDPILMAMSQEARSQLSEAVRGMRGQPKETPLTDPMHGEIVKGGEPWAYGTYHGAFGPGAREALRFRGGGLSRYPAAGNPFRDPGDEKTEEASFVDRLLQMLNKVKEPQQPQPIQAQAQP